MLRNPMVKKYPTALAPTSTYAFSVGNEKIEIPRVTPTFTTWRGLAPTDTYGGKAILDHNGKPAFAELHILWSFIEAGWDGVWVDSFKRKYRRGYWDTPVVEALPELATTTLSRICPKKFPQGCWDVMVWRDPGEVMFIESKRKNRDRIRETQTSWLENGLNAGLKPDSFLLVEWSID